MLFLSFWQGEAFARDGDKRLTLVTSFSVIADMARQVGGDHVEIVNLIAPGTDPHSYQPSPRDAMSLSVSDLVIVNGLGLEGWLERFIKASGYKGPVVVASRGTAPVEREQDHALHDHRGHDVQGNAGHADPHAWNSITNALVYVDNIAASLIAADPAHASDYEKRRDAYKAELRATQEWALKKVENLPASNRKVITNHRGFGYLGAEYGIIFLSAEGFMGRAQPSAASFAALIEQMRREKIRAVFFENTGNPRLLQQAANETGAVLGGALYAESLSPPSGPASTYLAMFRYNIETLANGMAANR